MRKLITNIIFVHEMTSRYRYFSSTENMKKRNGSAQNELISVVGYITDIAACEMVFVMRIYFNLQECSKDGRDSSHVSQWGERVGRGEGGS